MEQTIGIENAREPRLYKASRYWASNVWGATIAGIGVGGILLIVAAILLIDSEGPPGRRLGAALVLGVATTLLAMFPGNLIAAVPVAVEIASGAGLRLIAPLKTLFIPIEEVSDVRDSALWQVFQQGTVVKLNRRHGLLKSFAIHWAYGTEGRELALAIKQELRRREANRP